MLTCLLTLLSRLLWALGLRHAALEADRAKLQKTAVYLIAEERER